MLASHPAFKRSFLDWYIPAMEMEGTYEMCYTAWFLNRLGVRGFLSTVLRRLRVEKDQNKRAYLLSVLETLNDKEAADWLLEELSLEKDFFLQTKLIQLLGAFGDFRATPLIIEILAKPSEHWHNYGLCEGVKALGDPQLINPLFARLERETESQSKYEIALAIASLLAKQSIEHLMAAIAHDHNHVARCVVDELGELGDNRAVAPLSARLLLEKRPVVAASIASALAKLRSPQCVSALSRRLEWETDSNARTAIENALKECSGQPDTPKRLSLRPRTVSGSDLFDKRSMRVVARRMKSERNFWKRRDMVSELGESGDIQAAKVLLSQLKRDKSRWVRKDIANALGLLRDFRAIGPLLLHLKGKEHKDVRKAIMETIWQLAVENKVFIPIPEKMTIGSRCRRT